MDSTHPIIRPPNPDSSATPPPSFVIEDIASTLFTQPSTRNIPRSEFLAPPSSMSADEDNGDGAPTPPAAPSPFNFQTQVISTAPVKSVSTLMSFLPLSWLTLACRILANGVAIGTSIVASRPNIRSSKNLLLDPLLSCQRPCRYRP